MESWDPAGVAHLESILVRLSEIGLTDFLRGKVRAVWTANRDRHEPEELGDDSWTLASQSSRNLANLVHADVEGDSQWRSVGVSATKEHNAAVLHVLGAELRLVKVPAQAGRRPGFASDFEWREGARLDAAERNNAVCGALAPMLGMASLFEVERPQGEHPVRACRDVFVVWAGDPASGLTSGWLGLPTTGPDRWLAVVLAWRDEPQPTSVNTDKTTPQPGDVPSFGNGTAPKPAVTLKPQVGKGTQT
ncbi:hypothetical protein [Amycolatopsis sp. NPDC051071]|uniref:hypothetical protein n=1 Tax=Amycolatopsis sp. NPDC051071 TaxID=3154637 RepID=UPI00342C9E9A